MNWLKQLVCACLTYGILLLTSLASFACTPVSQAVFNPTDYYSSVQTSDTNSLRSSLNAVIKNHTYYSYSPCTWSILSEADEDPNNSNNVIGLYTRRSIPKSNRDQGGNTPDFWNREHTWPKSHGFSDKSQFAHTDGHALFATDKSVNADRGNLDFGEGATGHNECSGCAWGNGFWEPPDEVKGDIARAMFYMDIRYEGGDNSGVGDLQLLDRSTSVGELALGKVCTLLQWHLDDPVSAAEQNRLSVIYRWQGNRNPFIDHPEWVLPLWGPACGIDVPIETPLVSDEDVPLPLWAMILLASFLGVIGLKPAKGAV